MKEKELKLDIEELEERIAPGFMIEPPAGPGNEVTAVNAAKGSAAFGNGDLPGDSNGDNTAWNAHRTGNGPISNLS